MLAVLLSGQIPDVVYITVYVPAVLAETSIIPETTLIDNPAGEEENVPPGVPLTTGDGSLADWQ